MGIRISSIVHDAVTMQRDNEWPLVAGEPNIASSVVTSAMSSQQPCK
jgi:hypothetical protein